MTAHRIAVIPGDGIGHEVIEAGLSVLEAVRACWPERPCEIEIFPWGSRFYSEHGSMMEANALETLAAFDAIYFGATGWPSVPDHVSLWGLRLAIVQGFDQAVNVRPVRLLPGVESPLACRGRGEIDFVVVRENSEGEYAGAGGRVHRGFPAEVAVQTSVYSRRAIERVARHAFELARRRPAKSVTSVTKSNASQYASVLWDEVMREAAADYPDVAFTSVLVDAAAARFVLAPESLDVVVGSNLHADILSDLAAALAGSLGVAPSGNYHLDGRYPSMFEPVHGSAPQIAGKGTANPIAAILSLALMLEDLGEDDPASLVRMAVDDVCAAGIMTPDLGGSASTVDVADAVADRVRELNLTPGGRKELATQSRPASHDPRALGGLP